MINEYAVDPSLLNSWEMVRFYLDKFGIDQGRLLAQYPSSRIWADAVRKTFPSPTPAELVMARKRVEERLAQILKTSLLFAAGRSGAHWNPGVQWVMNAEQEHLKRAFHAIVTRENPGKRPHVIVGDEINEDTPPERWRVERSRMVTRSGPDMAEALTPLFRLAQTVIFIDRYFDPLDDGFQNALTAFLCRLWDCCRDRANLRVEYHTGNADRPGEYNPRKMHTAAEFVRLCQANLAAFIPRGMRVKFIRWRYRELHDRYVITDRAAVKFGQGLDEAGRHEANKTVELTLLDTAASKRHYDDFIGPKPRYTPDPGSTVEVVGIRPC